MKKGIVIKPYWGFEIGDEIYIKETDLTFEPSVDIYKENNLSHFVVTTWDIEMLSEYVRFEK